MQHRRKVRITHVIFRRYVLEDISSVNDLCENGYESEDDLRWKSQGSFLGTAVPTLDRYYEPLSSLHSSSLNLDQVIVAKKKPVPLISFGI
jgi:hypothetical protein